MPVDYSQNGKAQNERFLARELDQETQDARADRIDPDATYAVFLKTSTRARKMTQIAIVLGSTAREMLSNSPTPELLVLSKY